MELVSLRTHERECLFLTQGVVFGEGDLVLLADPIEESGNVRLLDGGTFLGVEFEGSAFGNSRELGLRVHPAACLSFFASFSVAGQYMQPSINLLP